MSNRISSELNKKSTQKKIKIKGIYIKEYTAPVVQEEEG